MEVNHTMDTVTDDTRVAEDGSGSEMKLLAASIYDYVNDNDDITRYKINRRYADKDDPALSAAIGYLVQKGALEYHPSGIRIGSASPPWQTPDDETSDADGTPWRLASIERSDKRLEEYMAASGLYHPTDDIAHSIESMPDPVKRDALKRCFLGSEEEWEEVLDDKRLRGMIDEFCDRFRCDESDVALFTEYFIPSNLFLYVLNRPVSYHRMMRLKHRQGSTSPELLLDPVDGDGLMISVAQEGAMRFHDRFRRLVQGYAASSGRGHHASIMECCLFLLNDHAVDIGSLNHLAYSLHDTERDGPPKPFDSTASVFDDRITTPSSVKHLSSGNIRSVLSTLRDAYGGRAVTPEKLFKANRKMLLQHYVEDLSEFEQLIDKYSSHEVEEGYVCFDTDLGSAVSNHAREQGLFDQYRIAKTFVRYYGGDARMISGLAEGLDLKSEDDLAKQMTGDQYDELTARFENYSWTSVDNARDVFEYKCGCGDLFSSYNMHVLGFNIHGDAYYRKEYKDFRECLKETVFTGDDLFVDHEFRVNLGCRSFKREVDYLMSNLMWIPVAESRYVNLRAERYGLLYEAAKRCRPLLEEMCRDDYLTAYRLKRRGTGVGYIDDDDFETVFYDALLMSTRAKRSIILKQKVYRYGDGTLPGISGFIKHIVNAEGGESDIPTIRSIMRSEYGIVVDESSLRSRVNQSDCIFFRETDMVYEDETSYRKAKGNG